MDNAVDVHIPADELVSVEDGFYCTKCHSVAGNDLYNPNQLTCRLECTIIDEGSFLPEHWIRTIVYHTKGDRHAKKE